MRLVPTDPAVMLDCETVARRLWDYLDARSPILSKEEVERHLAACVACHAHVAFARTMRRIIHEIREPMPATEQHAALGTRVCAAMTSARSSRSSSADLARSAGARDG